MDQFTRRIIGFGVHSGDVDGLVLCGLLNRIVAGSGLPRYLSSDHDPLFEYHRWRANLRVFEVKEIKTVPYVPLSHPFVERLIATIRREFLDQVMFWNAVDLARKLDAFRDYYNADRVHALLDGETSAVVSGQSTKMQAELASCTWPSHCHGLVELPIAT